MNAGKEQTASLVLPGVAEADQAPSTPEDDRQGHSGNLSASKDNPRGSGGVYWGWSHKYTTVGEPPRPAVSSQHLSMEKDQGTVVPGEVRRNI